MGRTGKSSSPRGSRQVSGAWLEIAAGIVAGLIVWVVATGFEARAYAMYFTPRVAVYYPLVLVFLLLFVVKCRPGWRALRVDGLDGLLAAFAGWQVVTALLSPSPALAWFGVLNRGGGAVLWLSVAALVFAARRLLTDRRAVVVFVWVGSFTVLVTGVVAIVQMWGGSTVWSGAEAFWEQGRMTGSSGNPVNLSGMCLFAVWLGAVALTRADLPRSARVAAASGAVMGLVGQVLAIGRAGYIGLMVGAVVCAAALLLVRRWRAVLLVGLAAVMVLGLTLMYSASLGEEVGGIASRVEESATGELSLGDQYRTEFWRIALDAVREKPVTGYGQGAYVVAYRAFVSPETAAAQPNTAVSDPHQVALLLASGSGVPGLLLGGGVLVSVLVLCAIRFLKRRREGGFGESRWAICAPEVPPLVYGLAASAFLAVSPVDLVVAAPLGLVLGSGLGGPSAGAWSSWEIGQWSGGKTITYVLSAVAVAGVVATFVVGVRFLQADVAFGEAMRNKTAAEAQRATNLMPLVPEYAQVAGAIMWRRGLGVLATGDGAAAEADHALVTEGETILLQGVRHEPTSVNLRVELIRLYLATRRTADAAEQAATALTYSPHHPILQALLASAVLQAQTELKDQALAADLLAEAEILCLDSPDGNYWMAQVYGSFGDTDAARQAVAKAQALAPYLKHEDYLRRVQTGR
ncbi:MAG: O-antigen ligase family protein [Actinobacteria bacterium]|nr:O-antigen ligase family protein [Actinomycetota bacterium]